MIFKEKILCIVSTIIISLLCIIPILDFKVYRNEEAKKLYRVYLNGKNIGVINSKEKLEEYINEEQKDLKDKYGVSTIYAPKGLYISEYISYDTNVVSEKEIYEKIKDTEKFTIKGYEINIKTEEENDDGENEEVEINLNVLSKDDFKNAVTNVVKAFVDIEDLDIFLSGEEFVIEDTGKKIEDLYIKQTINIKEAFIPSDEKILLNEKDITKYLLFGDVINEKMYKVKAGDTIESIAENNKLAVEELLVVNQDLKSKNNILSIGQEISVALISPIVTVVEEEHSVVEKEIAYTTEIEYDSSMPYGSTKIKQEGKNGTQIITQKIKYENGEIVNALIADTEVVEEVINRIKVVGTKSLSTINPEDIPDSGDWYWPTLSPYIITSPYGWRWGTIHEAVDISGTGYGSPIYAANNGTVYKVFYDQWGGNQIIIAHSNNYYTWYAHLANFASGIKAGVNVKRGQRIASMGCTGSLCFGTHLHFGAYIGIPGNGGASFDPMKLYG